MKETFHLRDLVGSHSLQAEVADKTRSVRMAGDVQKPTAVILDTRNENIAATGTQSARAERQK